MISLIVLSPAAVRKAALMLALSLLVAVLYLGTPDPAQAVTIDRCGSLESNETWTSGNVYVVTCDYYVMGGVTLTIQAGTVVKFDHRVDDLHVIGDLIVQGTASNPVVFTSYQDDSHGGDTNGDGAATSPAPGDWGSVNLRNSANTLVYTLIQYGGGGDNFGNAYGGLHILDSSPTVEHNIIRFNDIYGIYVDNGSPTIKDNNIEDSTQYGLYVNSGSPTVSNNTFNNSGTRHLSYGANADPTYTSNTFSGTGSGAIDVFGDSLSSEVTWVNVQGLDWPYLVFSDLTISSAGTLRLPAGIVVKFDNYGTDLIVEGTLDVQGNAPNQVVFTSSRDDSYGGDTNGDGASTTPADGNWGSIQFYNSANILDYTIIQYGGGTYGSVYIKDSSPTVEHNLIRNNINGIIVSNGSPAIKYNDIKDSSSYGLSVSTGSPTVSDNTFTDSGNRHLSHGANAEPAYSGNTFSGTGGGAINTSGGYISSDITWENVQGLNWPYHLRSDLTINSDGTLRLPAGTVVKFNSSETNLYVKGLLDVQGNTSNRVVFTSYRDDSYGGDTNGDGAATLPAPGDWGSIQLHNSANILDYTLIQYGSNIYGGVYIDNCSPTIENNIIRFNSYGIYVDNGSPTIKDNTIEESSNCGLYVNKGSPTVMDNDIKDSSSYGLSVSTGSPTVTDNTFTDSGTHHLKHGANANPTYSGNTFSGTGGGAIDVFGGTIRSDITWENIQGLNWPYLLLSDLIIGSDVTLTIQAGTLVKFEDLYTDLAVEGTLDVQGTAGNRVVFTSYRDDSYGGDTNGDGAATSPAPGDWGSIKFRTSANTLDYTLIQYGGNIYGGVYIDNCSPTVEYNIIRYNSNGINVSSGSPTIRQNDITGTTNYGVYNHSTTIDAAHNWWGHASGPSGVGPGSGDAVSEYVNYTPWLDAPANPISEPPPPSSSLLTYLPFVLR